MSTEELLYINYKGAPFVPSLSDSPEVMERTIDVLIENPNVSRVIFEQEKNFNYDKYVMITELGAPRVRQCSHTVHLTTIAFNKI